MASLAQLLLVAFGGPWLLGAGALWRFAVALEHLAVPCSALWPVRRFLSSALCDSLQRVARWGH
eukprot:15411821-Alexandrium_andersonii.AAC.1